MDINFGYPPVFKPSRFPSSLSINSFVEMQYSRGSKLLALYGKKHIIDSPLPKYAATSVWP